MNFPKDFENLIKDMLGGDYDRFLDYSNKEVFRGLRVNTIKISSDNLLSKLGYSVEPSLFCDESFYIPEEIKSPGNHPLHHAGAFYIQEPSASAPVSSMNIEKGDRVLDLCAAPGGKTTQIAACLDGTGLILSNEYVKNRTQPLISNIERMGIKNAVVTSAHPDELCSALQSVFDKVLVDAPCSGEGMFRKEPKALENWSEENSISCGIRQLHILNSAAKSVKGGGVLCYSTCTFSKYENEMVVENFIKENPDFTLIKIDREYGENGYKKYAPNTENIGYTRHIFPFNKGEGHFVALFRKSGDDKGVIPESTPTKSPAVKEFLAFFDKYFESEIISNSKVFEVNGKVYITPVIPNLKNLSVLRSGVLAGEYNGKRFEPSHALFSAFGKYAKNIIDLSLTSDNLSRFLRGEEIECEACYSGYTAVLVEGIPLSFGKASNGRLKNHYPKGLRILK